jgi:broad specificity phosphatase PhoE
VRRHGLDGSQLSVLLVLWMTGPPHRLSPTRLSRNIAQSPSGMTHTVKRLTSAGLVSRVGLETDGRAKHVELTDLGVKQATAVGRWLAELPADLRPQVVITSPYLRARETWRIAAAASGLELPPSTTDDRLVDRLMGDLELMTAAAVAARVPAEAARRSAAGEYRYAPPGGESFADVEARLGSFLTDLNRDQAGKRVIVVAHDAVVLMTRAVIESLSWDEVVELERSAGSVRNASITRVVERDGRLALDHYNRVEHL